MCNFQPTSKIWLLSNANILMEFAIKIFFSFTFIFTPEWKGNYYTWISVPRELISLKLEISQSVCARIKLRGANYNLATYFHNRGSLLNARRAWTLRVETSVYLSQQRLHIPPEHTPLQKKIQKNVVSSIMWAGKTSREHQLTVFNGCFSKTRFVRSCFRGFHSSLELMSRDICDE